MLYLPYNTEEIRHAYKSEHNRERENQVILLIITDGKKNWKNCQQSVREDHDLCYIEMPNEHDKVLKYFKSMKIPFITYADLESLLQKWALVIIILKNYPQPK